MKSLALLLLGAWLAGSLIMFFVATQNFRTVDRILTQPGAEAAGPLGAVPAAALRPLLRHLASELNRLYFFAWGIVQIVLGLAVLALVFRDRTPMILAASMLLLAAGLALFVTPQITEIGRELDFVSRNPLPPASAPLMAQFWKLHAAFTGLDGVKIVLGFFLAWKTGR
jgi:hypothetical protein